jgi:hypothetical protein
VQHPRGIADLTGIQGHLDDLLFDFRGATGVGVRQEKRPSTPWTARTGIVNLLKIAPRRLSLEEI